MFDPLRDCHFCRHSVPGRLVLSHFGREISHISVDFFFSPAAGAALSPAAEAAGAAGGRGHVQVCMQRCKHTLTMMATRQAREAAALAQSWDAVLASLPTRSRFPAVAQAKSLISRMTCRSVIRRFDTVVILR